MSLFRTDLPVDLSQVTKHLPKDAKVTRMDLIQESDGPEIKALIQFTWESWNLVTPFTIAVNFPVEQLKAKELPVNVKVREKIKPAKRNKSVDALTTAQPKQ